MARLVKVVPRIFGGIGNQLFIYAAARRLALATDSELVIDDVSGFAYDREYRRGYQLHHFKIPCRKAKPSERFAPLSRIRRHIARRASLRLPFHERDYIQQEGNAFEPRLLEVKPKSTLHLEGYWQSEKYFKDVEEIIRRDLEIIPPRDCENVATADQISGRTAVAIHMRFFDDPSAGCVNNVPSDYYVRALAEMELQVPNAHYFLFSDSPAAARERLSVADDRVTLVAQNVGDAYAYADLWLMTQCQHFIIANSTFSWWGAWLAPNPSKVVIAPRFVLDDQRRITSWNFPGLLPERWLKL